MAAALSARCSTAVRNELPIPLANSHVDGVSDRQTVERGQRRLVLAAQYDQDIVEAGGADLPDRAADERLVAERQEELLRSHPRRRARREHHCAHHGK